MAYVFSDTTYVDNGLIQECEDICNLGAGGISGNTAKLKTFTRRLNMAKDRFFAIAFEYDQLWNFDDRRYADGDQNLPIATTNLVSGTKDYLFDDELLSVTQVFIKDPSGNWVQLDPQDDRNAPNAYTSAVTGTPSKYELVGNSIVFDITPNYSQTGGIKVTFRRGGVKFNYTDGAVAIGIPSLFFKFLANHASYPYVMEKGLKHVNHVKKCIIDDEAAISQFISNRAKPKRGGLRVVQESNR